MTDPRNAERRAMSVAVERVTGRRFCTSCQSDQPPAGGRITIGGDGRPRFRCAACLERARLRAGGAA
jgi:hypothetical protein